MAAYHGGGDGLPGVLDPGHLSAGAAARLLGANSVVLVGASAASSWTGNLLANLDSLGFTGQVDLVNPRGGEILGRSVHRSVAELEHVPDCAWVMVGTERAEAALEELGAHGIRSAVFLTSGFREVGAAGAERERRLVARARELGVALLGPNCLGFVDFHRSLAAYGLTVAPPLVPGGVALVTQSGAVLLHLHRLAQSRAAGLAHLVSIGNEGMLTAADFFDAFVEDDRVRVLGGLLEGIRDAPAFLAAAGRALDAGKPVVVLKVGRNAAASRAIAAHTGSLAGEDAVVDAAFRQHGIIRVRSLEELVETSALLAARGWPRGRRTAVISTSGGACGLVADLAEGTRLELPDFPEATKRRMAELLPEFGTAQNPLDTTGVIVDRPGLLGQLVEAAAASGAYDAVLVNADPAREPGPNPERPEARIAGLRAALDGVTVFAAAASTAASELTPYAREVVMRHGVHFANGLALGVAALDHAIAYGEMARAPRPGPTAPTDHHPPPLVAGWTGQVDESSAKRLLELYGVEVPAEWVARSAAEAAAVAEQIGFPVVLKVHSAAIAHKTEVGGVRLGLRDAGAVAAAFTEILEAAATAAPGTPVDGVLVASQVEGAVAELIVGARNDPDFGPVVAAGLGGVFVEVLGDAVLRLPPLDAVDAMRMLGELRGADLLTGARGRPVADLEAAARAIVAVSEIARDLGPRLVALEVNPLFVLPEGRGALAGDALLVLD